MRDNEKAKVAWALSLATLLIIALFATYMPLAEFGPLCDVENAIECSCKAPEPPRFAQCGTDTECMRLCTTQDCDGGPQS